MKKTLVFVDNKAQKGIIGKYKWVFVEIDGVWCWKRAEQLIESKHEVKFRSARQ